MKHARLSLPFGALLLASSLMVSGCSILQAAKLVAPESFNLKKVGADIYVEDGAGAETAVQLSEAMDRAEAAIRRAYGGVLSRPIVHACVSERCYTSFGGGTSVAKVYGDRMLLSPRGLNWHFLAHEWSHIEMRRRLSLSAWWRMPQWFDEGVAVAISEAPEHSEQHWRYLVSSNTPRPSTQELYRLASLSEWLEGVHRYGDDTNMQRRANGQPEIHALYATAGHELRPWLAAVCVDGLLRFVAKLNEGEDFMAAYEQQRLMGHERRRSSQCNPESQS